MRQMIARRDAETGEEEEEVRENKGTGETNAGRRREIILRQFRFIWRSKKGSRGFKCVLL